MSLVHLHTHSEYSLLDGLNRIQRMVDTVCMHGQKALALTDHGVMYGVVDFYKTCIDKMIKPIIGCELYFTDRSRHQKESRDDAVNYHIVLLAKNQTGYQNLCKLVSLAHIEGFYYKPRIDWELLEANHEGLIALSGCIKGHVSSLLLEDRKDEARDVAIRYQKLFGEDYYFEIQNHGLEEQLKINPLMAVLGKELGIALVATQDAHYPSKKDAMAHDLLLCVQTLRDYEDPHRLRFSNNEFYIKSEDEMKELFAEYPEAIENTQKIADKCHLEFDFTQIHLPAYKSENIQSMEDREQHLKDLCYKQLKVRYGENPSQEIIQRLDYELDIIIRMKFVDYFLVVQDFVNEAKRRNIYVGPGRGSAAGSIVSYLLNITGIDPLQYHLYFERFLNPDRINMPDIDIDFEDERRDEVIDYVREKYGFFKVAQVATFGRMEARGVIRDVARAFKFENAYVNRICKTIIPGKSLDHAYANSPEFKAIIDSDEKNLHLFTTAKEMEGQTRNFSVHAAGVVIGNEDLWNYIPLQLDKNKHLVTQYDKDIVEEMGLLKIDFLGLRNLTVIRECIQMIASDHQIKIDIDTLPLDDPEVFQLYKKANTKGVFQVESQGMRQIFRELNPSTIEDIIAVIALYRPGPMDLIKVFLRNKAYPEGIVYENEVLRPILESTYGVCVYQEQVMEIARKMGGFSLGKADLLRKAMGKKKKDIMEELKLEFIAGAEELGYTPELAQSIFTELEKFADYGFNRAHAAAYAVISYQTAWLKTHYPQEYMTALLNSIRDDENKLSQYIAECRQMDINVLPPDINHSQILFSKEQGGIRYGLLAIKNAGKIALDLIIENRNQQGPFKSLPEFSKRMTSGKVNKKVIESLIKAGAFDELEPDRGYLLEHMDRPSEPEVSLFDLPKPSPSFVTSSKKAIDKHQHMLFEKEALGFYFSMNPFTPYKELYNEIQGVPLEEAVESASEKESIIEVFALIEQIRQPRKKNSSPDQPKNTVLIVTLSDLEGSMELVAFGKNAEVLLDSNHQETAAWLTLRIKKEDDRLRASLCEIKRLITREEMMREQSIRWRLELFVDLDALPPESLKSVSETLKKYPGTHPIRLVFYQANQTIHASTPLQVEKTPQLEKELAYYLDSSQIGWKRCED